MTLFCLEQQYESRAVSFTFLVEFSPLIVYAKIPGARQVVELPAYTPVSCMLHKFVYSERAVIATPALLQSCILITLSLFLIRGSGAHLYTLHACLLIDFLSHMFGLFP